MSFFVSPRQAVAGTLPKPRHSAGLPFIEVTGGAAWILSAKPYSEYQQYKLLENELAKQLRGGDMLVRLDNNELVEYPDEVGALLLADPAHGDVPNYSLEEINCLISGGFAALYDGALTLEQNIEQAKEHYTMWGKPTASNMEKALAQIKYYNENITPADVVSMDFKQEKEPDDAKISQLKTEVLTR